MEREKRKFKSAENGYMMEDQVMLFIFDGSSSNTFFSRWIAVWQIMVQKPEHSLQNVSSEA